MASDRFVYITYIRTTPDKLWDALTKPEFTRAYWFGTWPETTWVPGAPWKLMVPDGRVGDSGSILEADRPRRLVIQWRNELYAELRAEGYSRCTLELEPTGDTVKLTVTHEMDVHPSKFITGVSNGWPPILSSLKTLLETGDSLEFTKHWPKGIGDTPA
jgi:uncharacterized protein YndB with AHSA1/START domain